MLIDGYLSDVPNIQNQSNMKAAILISGYLRTIDLNLSSLNMIKSKFDHTDIYLHITLNESDEDKYYNPKNKNDIDNIKSLLNPLLIIEEHNKTYTDKCDLNNILNTWNKVYKLNYLKLEHEKNFGKYDVVIKYRPDLHIIDDIEFSNLDKINVPTDSKIDKSKLLNENDPYICDIFAYGNSDIMNLYCDFFNHIPELYEKYGNVSETLLFHYLKNIDHQQIDINYNVILSRCNVFAICGDSGSGKTTLGNLLKHHFSKSFMFECDRYHKWERNDENWKSITHLHPGANYIGKMNQDIFDLKIGKTIYQVDYNHSTGKFTEEERIDSSDNIIVCGLHSLYSDDNKLYDIKIFMDTDINLKYKWKVERDVLKRGYSLEKVINQIKSREDDYNKYILPQREKSDVIINFYTDKKFSTENLNEDFNVYLNIHINKNINIFHIINSLLKAEINFSITEDIKYNTLTFTQYKYADIFKSTNTNNFYDYIVFIILNLVEKNNVNK